MPKTLSLYSCESSEQGHPTRSSTTSGASFKASSSSTEPMAFPATESSTRLGRFLSAASPPEMRLSLSSSLVRIGSEGNPSRLVIPQLFALSSSSLTHFSRPTTDALLHFESNVRDSTSSSGVPPQASRMACSMAMRSAGRTGGAGGNARR